MQSEFVERVEAVVRRDARVRSAWLGGSLGRGAGDRFSDVDLHLLIARGQAREFRAGAEAWLSALADLVLYRPRFGGLTVQALTTEGLRLDLWLHEEGERLEGYSSSRSRVLHDPRQLLLEPTLEAKEPLGPARAERLSSGLEDFWSSLTTLPKLVGRGELIDGVQSLGTLLGLVCRLLIDGQGIRDGLSARPVNEALSAELRAQLEVAIAPAGHGIEGMKRSHLGLAAIVSAWGPELAERHGFAYPSRLEQTVRAYLERELPPPR